MNRNLAMLAAAGLIICTNALGADTFAVAGSYGFDWTKPKKARCERVTDTLQKRFKSCEFSASGAFGLPLAYHSCALAGGGEMLLFRDRRECGEALETMHANAP